jgi:hypothetical protein
MELTSEASKAAWLNLQATLGPLPKRNVSKRAQKGHDGNHAPTCGRGLKTCEETNNPIPYWNTEDASSLGASPNERTITDRIKRQVL